MSGKKQTTCETSCPQAKAEGARSHCKADTNLYCERSDCPGVITAKGDGSDSDPAWEEKGERWAEIRRKEKEEVRKTLREAVERFKSLEAARRTDARLSLNRFFSQSAKDGTEPNGFLPRV